MAQVGDRELADAVEVVGVAGGGELAVVGACTVLPGHEVGGDVGDVVAVVGRLGPAGVAGLRGRRGAPAPTRRASRSARRRRCSRTRASTCQPWVSSRLQIASPSAAWRPWPTCSGPVGLAETNSTITRCAAAPAARPKARAGGQHLGDDACRAAARRRRLMKPGPAIVDRLDPALRPPVCALQRGDQRRRRPRADCACSALASGIAAVTARSPCAACLRRLERGGERAARAHFGDRRAQRVEQFVHGLGSSANSTRRRLRAPRPPRGAKSRASVNDGNVRAHCASDARCKNARRRPPPRCPSPLSALRSTPSPRRRRRRCRRRSASTACSAASAKARPARSSSAYDDFQRPRRRDQAGARRRPRRPDRRPLLGALLRRRGGAGRPAAAPERRADLRRGADPVEPYLVMEYVRRQHAAAATAAPTSCCRSS